ncbi:MAG TPA: hypothetical protein VGL46_05810 [Pseudonocardiaceae bacterium]|jgi:hypothetical protein
MSSLPPELAGPVEQLRVKLVEINGSEQTCMTNAAARASQGQRLPETQAIMARCRQTSAAAAASAINIFLDKCSHIGRPATSLGEAAILAATARSVSDFWAKSESNATALVSEAAAELSALGPDKTIQAINNIYSDRVSSISRYFEQLTT